jgi:hypothetical protein
MMSRGMLMGSAALAPALRSRPRCRGRRSTRGSAAAIRHPQVGGTARRTEWQVGEMCLRPTKEN